MTDKRGISQAFFSVLGFMALCVTFAGFNVNAQNLRLRSNLNPLPTNTSLTKYADITAEGNIAVMGSYSARGAFIFDISNPDAPVLKAHYNPTPQQQFLEAIVVGNRAYFGSGTGNDGVHIVDITNPANPILLGKVNATTGGGYNTIHEMVVDGDFLYINSNSTANRNLKVINISNPAVPVFVRDIVPHNTGWVHAMYIRGTKLFTAGFFGNGLTEIYDVANIGTQAPTFIGEVVTGTSTHSSWASEDGNYLYVCREFVDGELRVYDIRNLANPVLVKIIKAVDLNINAVCPHNPIVKGNRLYVAWYQAGLQEFDISNPADPKRIGQYDTYAPQFVESEALAELDSANLESDDMICGSEALMQAVPSGYNGNWTAFPLLGEDKVLLADLATGLWIVDATNAASLPKNKVSDFDGDGKTDFAVYQPNNGGWLIERSSTNATSYFNFGVSTDVIRPGDYDGDGKADIAVYRTGNWYILNSADNTFRAAQFGQAGDIPVSADYDGDGKVDTAVFRPASGAWFVQRSTLGFYAQQWGANGDEPMVGDFDGDGKSDFTVVRTSGSSKFWYTIQSSSSLTVGTQFGISTDKVVVGDFDGDRLTDMAVFRPDAGAWYIKNSQTGGFTGVQFGVATDRPIPADYDGDGKTDIAVYRGSSNNFYGLRSTTGAFFAKQFGNANDIPTATSAQPQ